MSDLRLLLALLEAGQPFGFAHFNDGEVQAMADCVTPEGAVDFGWQRCGPGLRDALLAAMSRPPPHFYVGLPCRCEHFSYPFGRALALLNITLSLSAPTAAATAAATAGAGAGGGGKGKGKGANDYCPAAPPTLNFTLSRLSPARVTVANVFVNANYWYAHSELARILAMVAARRARPIHVVLAANLSDPAELPFPVSPIFVNATNAFDVDYPRLSPKHSGGAAFAQSRFLPGDVVLLAAGPLGRVLAVEWAWLLPLVTFVNVGSLYDQFLWARGGRAIHKTRACMHKTDNQASFR